MKFIRKSRRKSQGTLALDGERGITLAPFANTLRNYSREKFRADTRAAANVTMLALPQSIAYAAIAGLPIVYGIICSAVAAMVAPIFASSRLTVLGPTNATAFMLFSFFATHPHLGARSADLIPLLVAMVGIIAVLGSMLRIADLLQYVSRSVMVGYISGAAVLIIANQLKPWFGLGSFIDPESSGTFVGFVIELAKALGNIQWVPTLIGAVTIGIFFALRTWRPAWPIFAITLTISSVIFGVLIHQKIGPFAGVETFQTFSFADLQPELPDVIRSGFFRDLSELVGVACALAFVASLENSLMSKSLSSRSGERSEGNQDMFAVGIANIATSIASGMPASGSLTRSTLNDASGARTRLSSFYSGLYTLSFALLIAAAGHWGLPLIDYVPRSALAALVIALSFSLFNRRAIRICMHSTRDDALVLICTLIATLLAPLNVAIFIRVGISISLFLRKASRPQLVEYGFDEGGELCEMVHAKLSRPIPAISIVHVEGDLFFGAAELFRTQIQRTVADPDVQVIILRLKNAWHLDATSVMALEDLIRFMRGKGLHLIVSGATREVYRVLRNSGVLMTLQEGCDREKSESNLFLSHPRNPNLSTRAALMRAQDLIGTDKARIRIFHDPNQGKSSS
ncbi:MAG: SulP family inorganic anion transporter [Luteolibacter sp.]